MGAGTASDIRICDFVVCIVWGSDVLLACALWRTGSGGELLAVRSSAGGWALTPGNHTMALHTDGIVQYQNRQQRNRSQCQVRLLDGLGDLVDRLYELRDLADGYCLACAT
jgi:hypothetical protein